MTNADDNTYPPSPYGAVPTGAPYSAAPYGAPAAYGAAPTSPYGYSATSPDSYPPPSSSPYGQTEFKMGTDVYASGDVYTDHHHHHAGNQTFVMRLVTPSSRNRFVAKVYAIVAFQLLLVSLVCAPVIYSQSVRDAVDINEGLGLGLYITAAILELVFLCTLFCFRKKRGLNVLLLIAFTLCTGYIISVACSYVQFDEIVEAAVITFLIVISVLGYCLFTKADFGFLLPFIFCTLCLMLFWSFWSMWFWIFDIYYDWMYQVYCVLGVFVFIGYLLFDTSRIVLRIPEEEYILAAVTIYLDILNLFLFLLALIKK